MRKIYITFSIFIISSLLVFAQTNDNSKHKDFGSSLKKHKKDVKDNSKNNENKNADSESIRVETNLVVNDILVVNKSGNIVVGLKKEDFTVAEDGTAQEIEVFSSGENATIPHFIVLIIDDCVIIPEQLKNSIEAAKNLVDKLNPLDKMAIVGNDLKLLTDFTDDKTQLKFFLNSLKKGNFFSYGKSNGGVWADDGGRGKQFSSLMVVLNEMFDEKNIRPIVIIQSSGGEFYLLKPINERLSKLYQERDFSFNDVLNVVENSKATIYPIILQPKLIGLSDQEQRTVLKPLLEFNSKINIKKGKFNSDLEEKMFKFHRDEYLADQTALIKIADLSGGYVNFFSRAEDAESIYSDILKVIDNRYIIGYYPNNQIQDGKSRNVKIEVKGHPEYIILGRKNYISSVY